LTRIVPLALPSAHAGDQPREVVRSTEACSWSCLAVVRPARDAAIANAMSKVARTVRLLIPNSGRSFDRSRRTQFRPQDLQDKTGRLVGRSGPARAGVAGWRTAKSKKLRRRARNVPSRRRLYQPRSLKSRSEINSKAHASIPASPHIRVQKYIQCRRSFRRVGRGIKIHAPENMPLVCWASAGSVFHSRASPEI
jgi:hypothetical protein